MEYYSIIIPIYNEESYIVQLLEELEYYSKIGHEILIIDDASTDQSLRIIKNYKFVTLISHDRNKGKGLAIRAGLLNAKNRRIVLFDGDMELNPKEISKLMVLDEKNKVYSAMGYRFKDFNFIKSSSGFGNFIFTTSFNLFFNSRHRDILCCAKSFYLNNIPLKSLTSQRFSIDIELSLVLSIQSKNIPQIFLEYNRRNISQGKKLRTHDGWDLLWQIIKMVRFY